MEEMQGFIPELASNIVISCRLVCEGQPPPNMFTIKKRLKRVSLSFFFIVTWLHQEIEGRLQTLT